MVKRKSVSLLFCHTTHEAVFRLSLLAFLVTLYTQRGRVTVKRVSLPATQFASMKDVIIFRLLGCDPLLAGSDFK